MITEVTTPPTSEPISLSDAKSQIILDHGDDDFYINGLLIQSAREYAEQFTRRSIMPQTITAYLDEFSNEIELPFPPLRGVTSIQYVDADGATQTLDESIYTVDLPGRRILLSYGESWPSIRDQKNAVTIVYEAGYADEYAVPAKIKQAILILVAEMFANREQTTSNSVSVNSITADNLLYPYRDLRF